MSTDSQFNTIPRPANPKKTTRGRRARSKFEIWLWSPVLSFQVGLSGGYLGLIYFGVAASIASVPSIQQNSPDGYVIIWSLGLALGAAVAAVGSLSRKKAFEMTELVGSGLVSLTVGSYAILLTILAHGMGDVSKVSGSAGFTALAIPLIVRTLWLASQIFRK